MSLGLWDLGDHECEELEGVDLFDSGEELTRVVVRGFGSVEHVGGAWAPLHSGEAHRGSNLCESYWYPLYAYIRRQGYDIDEARDLTQGYFTRLLEKDYLNQMKPKAGRYRSFLLTTLMHFLVNEWNKAHASKRGGNQTPISLDTGTAEKRYRARRWACA